MVCFILLGPADGSGWAATRTRSPLSAADRPTRAASSGSAPIFTSY